MPADDSAAAALLPNTFLDGIIPIKTMPTVPRFKYFLYHTRQAVEEGREIWQAPIPLSRKPHEKGSGLFISHGDYFCAIRDGLAKDDFKTIAAAVSQQIRRHVAVEEIQTIHVILQKHGEFYHPARIETVLDQLAIPFVLNVAVSDAGKSCIQKEIRFLNKLNTDFPFAFVPKVYGQDCLFIKRTGFEVRMFLGQWFGGYNEFHLSRDPADDQLKIIVWDLEHGNFYLATDQTMALYRQAAKILTSYFNLETLEHIYAWHHAAGDFVIKCENDHVDVKLITVRQYGPMFANNDEIEPGTAEILRVLESMVVFFLNLVIRMRLDRLDGTGEIVWADKTALEPVLKGFMDGLALKPEISLLAEPLGDCFRKYIFSHSCTDLLDLNQAILHQYHPRSPDGAVIKQHLEQHAKDLHRAVQNWAEDS